MKAEWTNRDSLSIEATGRNSKSICDVVEFERIKSKVIVPINETIKFKKDESDWKIPSFMNKERQND